MASLRDKILAAKRPTRLLHVEEWGVEVGIRQLSLAERMDLLQAVADGETAHQAYEADQALPEDERKGVKPAQRLDHSLLMLMTSIVDPQTDKIVFELDDYRDFQKLGKVTLDRIAQTFFQMNIYRDQATASDLKKTSAPTTSDDSSSS